MENSNFALRLNRLFEEKRKPDGKPYSQTEVLDSLRGVLTRVYLWRLRKGSAANPGFHVIKALADFFGVNPGYFFENDDESSDRQWDLGYEINVKTNALDPESQRMVLLMVDAIQQAKKTEQA